MQILPVWQIAFLAIIQGLAELLPVSSSAHVILAQKWMGLDPGAPEMTFLLVMLHTGTMFAVLVYFWNRWRRLFRNESGTGRSYHFLKMIGIATLCTGVLGFGLKILIEKVLLEKIFGHSKGEVEHLFRNLPMMAVSLLAVGTFILTAGLTTENPESGVSGKVLGTRDSIWIGIVQGLCLPFRGFSRSGATISTGLLRGLSRELCEEFSFALAVVLTPPVIFLELRRLLKALPAGADAAGTHTLLTLLTPGLIGMIFSFGAGLLALKWLSSWLEKGRWRYFGIYCLIFAIVVFAFHRFSEEKEPRILGDARGVNYLNHGGNYS